MRVNNEIKRPFLSYFGAKWKIAPWVISFLPGSRNYVEPFGGSGAVLLRKPRSHTEVYNDLDRNVCNAFRMLRDRPDELVRALDLTPYAREEYERAFEECGDELEMARRFVVRCWLGHSQCAGFSDRQGHPGFSTAEKGTGGSRSMGWANYADSLLGVVDRMRGVVIENRPAMELFDMWDTAETAWYLDPPYVHKTRLDSAIYRHEMSDGEHLDMLERVRLLKGTVVLSGYGCDLYDSLLGDWERHERRALAGTPSELENERVEVLWVKGAGG